jgi:hypothetical protein
MDGKRNPPQPAPLLGQHNYEIFAGELGVAPDELAALTSERLI